MTSHIRFLGIVSLLILTSISFAAENEAQTLSFPYNAQITADGVNIRSGSGTNYYVCGKLDTNDRVTIVDHKGSWSCVVPPAGSFSWISKQYVEVNFDNPSVGVVSQDNARVWAGSPNYKPIHSTTMQVKLNSGDEVQLLGEEQSDYYKIAPPEGAYLWVSTQYTKKAQPIIESPAPAPVPATPAPTPPTPAPTPETVPPTAPPVPPQEEMEPVEDETPTAPVDSEANHFDKYYALDKKVQAELAKPLMEQDFSAIVTELEKIAQDPKAGKAGLYCDYAIRQIRRYQLAGEAAKSLDKQKANRKTAMKQIEQSQEKKMEKNPDLGKYTTVGTFELSKVYTLEKFKIIDKAGKILCYARPAEGLKELDFSSYVGQKVGLIGPIKPYPDAQSALITFSFIEALP